MTNAPRTNAEKAIQTAITDLWYQTYRKPLTTEQRNDKVTDFIAQHLEDGSINVVTTLFYHPETSRKIKQRSATIYDILGDYILRVDQVAENSEEYPITSQETEVRNAAERKRRERVMITQSEEDTEDENYRMPPYSVKESELEGTPSLEDEVFEETTPSVEEFRKQLEHVKANAHRYATKYAGMGYDYGDSIRRIRRLDPDRVRECRECGNAFYAHDKRRVVCDMQHGMTEKGVRSHESTCELNDDKRNSVENRNNSSKTA